jgi:TATA-binding protein-associated factor
MNTGKVSCSSFLCHLGQLAMDVLHKQVKPFMLRRLKTDVLNDLPPKILQDYYCDLSSIQCMLYEDFANKTKEQVKYVDNETSNQNGNPATGHVFKVNSFDCQWRVFKFIH